MNLYLNSPKYPLRASTVFITTVKQMPDSSSCSVEVTKSCVLYKRLPWLCYAALSWKSFNIGHCSWGNLVSFIGPSQACVTPSLLLGSIPIITFFLSSPSYSSSAWIILICVYFWMPFVSSGFRGNVHSSKPPLGFYFRTVSWYSMAVPFIAASLSFTFKCYVRYVLSNVHLLHQMAYSIENIF